MYTKYDMNDLELDYRDEETLEIHLPDGITVSLMKADVVRMLEGFNQDGE